jgi:RNA polymerase sigma-70 factor (ECF subfamily)
MKTMLPDELALANYDHQAVARPLETGIEPAAVGKEASFEQVFERYHSMVYNLIYRILGDREEALDVSQEVFVSVYRKLGRFRWESSLKTWIYRIAINRASNRCRWWNRLRRRGTVSLDRHLSKDDTRSYADALVAPDRSPEEAVLAREMNAEIERALIRLPMQQRAAVVMRDIEGLSYEEIAAALQVSLGTVKSRIARGREELKRRLNGLLG